MEPKPLLFSPDRRGGGAVATALGEPSLTLLESGPAIGVLIAESCREDSLGGRFCLEQVTWIRGDDAVRAIREFDGVCLYRTERQVWVAEEMTTGRLFPQPSRVPYHVLFLTVHDYQYLRGRTADGDAPAVFTYARERFGGLPGFSVRKERLLVPLGYAAASGEGPAGKEYVAGT